MRCALRQGIVYTRSLATGWKPPLAIRQLSDGQAQELRDKFHIIVEGDNLLPPIDDFAQMKFPPAVLRHLASKNIRRPTPIQMQVRRTPPPHELLWASVQIVVSLPPDNSGGAAVQTSQ